MRFGSGLGVGLAAGVSVASMTATVSGDVLVYEGFDYAVGPLSGQGEVADGWSGAWSAGASMQVVAESLDMPSLPFEPIGGSMGGNGSTHKRGITPGLIDLGIDQDYYVSFLIRRTGWTGSAGGEWLDVRLFDGPDSVASFSVSSAEHLKTYDIGANIGTPDGNNAGATEEVLLLVGKIQARADEPDQVFLKAYRANDVVDLSEPANWTVVGGAEASDAVVTDLWIQGGSSGSYGYQVDEIRITTDWGSAVGVPEPASVSLLLGGGLALCRRRR